MISNQIRFFAAGAVFFMELTAARADSPKAEALPPPDREAVSVQAFGDRNPGCLEWTNACQVCKRDDQGKPQCSTAGIACQPAAPICRIQKPAP